MAEAQGHLAILGGGSFGTALAHVAGCNGQQVRLWARNRNQVEEMRATRENRQYLPGMSIHEQVDFIDHADATVKGARIVVVAVPSVSFRAAIALVQPVIESHMVLMSATKGIDTGRFMLMSQVLREAFPDNQIAVISGPNLALELMQEKLTGSVVAADTPEAANMVRDAFNNDYFRVYMNEDMYGIELAGALKNIYALMMGYVSAIGMGSNSISMLMTRALAEMSRFAVAMGANPVTFLGLAGVGDLIATCTSSMSRNYQVGRRIGLGESVDEVMESLGQTAEGINTLEAVHQVAEELEISMPLVETMWQMRISGWSLPRTSLFWMQLEEGSAHDIEYQHL